MAIRQLAIQLVLLAEHNAAAAALVRRRIQLSGRRAPEERRGAATAESLRDIIMLNFVPWRTRFSDHRPKTFTSGQISSTELSRGNQAIGEFSRRCLAVGEFPSLRVISPVPVKILPLPFA